MTGARLNYTELVERIVERAGKAGQAEAYVQNGREASVRVRDGEIEDLTEASSKGVGLRVIVEERLGFAYTSDFTPEGLDWLVTRAIAVAKASTPNPLNGLPDKRDVGSWPDVGPLYDPAVAGLAPDWKIKTSVEMEKIVRAFDPRIKAMDSVGAGEAVGEVYFARSDGVQGSWRDTSVYLYASPVATDGEQLQTGSWYDAKRFFSELASPETVAREAAKRAVRLLGAKKVKSQKVPVVFDPTMAAAFIGSIAGAVNGDAVFKEASFLAGRLGETIAPSWVTIVDDGLLPRGLGTSPFDGEGVPTRRTPILDRGVLKAFLYDSFTARKAGTRTTGNAARGYSSLPHIGTNNLYLEAGTTPPEQLIREIKSGLYVTAMLGHGANLVTGEYSRGANGLWIEDGALAGPVQEITVAGNMLEMLESLDGIGSDLTFRGAVGAPTIRFKELTVSGE